MSKRSRPFDNDVIRQLKIHIRNTDHDKITLKEVQDKTLKKLLSAQKTLSNRKNDLVENRIGCDVGVNDDEIGCCTYCDWKSQDIHKCNICYQMYCQNCSFPDYKKDNEGRICKTCS